MNERLYYRTKPLDSKDPKATQFTGVLWVYSKNKYKATYQGVTLGYFTEAITAARAYAKARQKQEKTTHPYGRGVYYSKTAGKFGAKVTRNGVLKFLGYFEEPKDAEKAIIAYDDKLNSWTQRRHSYDYS